jgi:serine/threonine-protein kinase
MAREMPGFDTIFCAAIAITSPEERSAYIANACGDDGQLRGRVEKLVSAHFRAGNFLEAPAVGLLAVGAEERQAAREVIREGPGTVIGPYKLLEQIGEGGFGVVFMAEQMQPVRRKVALKVLKPGMDTRQVVARFEAERQALALMDHPNIAHVFDGGETTTGRPYFVMELVRGTPITDFCDQNDLPVRERLELFVSVCQAVQHAHQKGIIHRDLKPSNVMVTMHDDKAVVKVIDFGIAKATGQQLTDKTLFTNFAQMIGTPLYMAPEQAGQSGLDVDTRSDIYSLGVLLYELLTGTTPFDQERVRQASYDEMRRMIREEDPPRPSTRISTLGQAATTVSARRKSDPRRLSQLFRGELDWIVMKALEKDRNRRYETASAFAADVQHYLQDQPVLACPPSAWYRLRKYARRNKAGLALAVCLFSTAAVLAGSFGWIARDRAVQRTEIERDRQTRRQNIERRVNDALADAELLRRQERWPEAMAAAQRAEGVLAGASGSDELRRRVEELRADIAMVVRLEEIHSRPKDDAYASGKQPDSEYALAFRDYGIDIDALSPQEAAERIRERTIRLQLARAIDAWAGMRKRANKQGGRSWKELLEIAAWADPDEWRSQFRAAMRQGDRPALEKSANSVPITTAPPATLHLLFSALRGVGAVEPAVVLLRRAQRQYPGDLWLNEELGWYCTFEVQPRRYEEGLRFTTAALALRPRNANLYYTLGMAHRGLKQWDEYIGAYGKALELKPDADWVHLNLRPALIHVGKQAEPTAAYRRAIQIKPAGAITYLIHAHALHLQGHFHEAFQSYEQAFAREPKFARTPYKHRYNAACTGALAGCGRGKDAGKLDEMTRTRLRRQALEWLRADLTTCQKYLHQARPEVQRKMKHWLQDPDFAGVRGAVAMAQLPASERQKWQQFWAQVELLLRKAESNP